MQLLCKKRSLGIQQYSSKGFRLWRRKKRIFGGKGPMDPSPNFLPNNNFQSVCGPPKCYYFFKILFSNGYIDHWESKSWYPKISSNLLNTLLPKPHLPSPGNTLLPKPHLPSPSSILLPNTDKTVQSNAVF